MTKLQIAVAALALALSTNASAQDGPFAIQSDSPRVGVAQDRMACSKQDYLPWCGSASTAGSQREWTTKDIQEVQAQLTAKLNYSYNPTAPWRSSLDQVTAGRAWSDDCDGLVFTMLEALDRAGFPRTKMWRAIVRPNGSASSVRHMVGIVEVEGAYLVVGDTNIAGPYPLAAADFRPDLLSRASDGKHWLRVQLNARPATILASR